MNIGIRGRLVSSYLLLIVLTVLLFEAFILSSLRFYYVEGVKRTLTDQGINFSSFYKEELSSGTLENKASVLLHNYDFLINAQVQIINHNGDVLADTHNSQKMTVITSEEVATSLTGKISYYSTSVNGEKVLAVAQPIIIEEKIVGIIRLITSMEPINKVFKQNVLLLGGIGCLVIIIGAFISYFLANSITKPLNTITAAAETIANGNLSIRVNKEKNDEIGKLADTLNYLAEQVEKHERLKNEFIASISHELRTPLTSVKGWAITLHSMSDDPIFKDGLDIISNESERLSKMLGDLLDLSSLSSGKVEYKFDKLSLQKLIQQTVNQLKPRADRMGISLTIEKNEHLLLSADGNRLKQVFINVIDNAIKFTPNGGYISIKSELVENCASIKIIDSGEGISMDELQLVKEKFHKGKSTASGTGLGLAVCQEIILAHNGLFELKSEPGHGTTVEIILPLLSISPL